MEDHLSRSIATKMDYGYGYFLYINLIYCLRYNSLRISHDKEAKAGELQRYQKR